MVDNALITAMEGIPPEVAYKIGYMAAQLDCADRTIGNMNDLLKKVTAERADSDEEGRPQSHPAFHQE